MLNKLQVYLEKLLLALAVAILVAILLLVMADILARNLLGQPIRGVTEFLSQTLYLVVFLGLASAFRQGAFIRSDLVYRYPLGRRWKRGLELAHLTVTLAVFVLLTAMTFQSLIASLMTGQWVGLPGYFSFPEWPFRLLTFLGTLLLTSLAALRWVAMARRKGTEAVP